MTRPSTWRSVTLRCQRIEAGQAEGADLVIGGNQILAESGGYFIEATIFDGVVISVGGPEFYEKTMIDLDPMALKSADMLEAFNRMEKLRGYVDEVIEPARTRAKLIGGLRLLENKRDTNPPKKHGNIPL